MASWRTEAIYVCRFSNPTVSKAEARKNWERRGNLTRELSPPADEQERGRSNSAADSKTEDRCRRDAKEGSLASTDAKASTPREPSYHYDGLPFGGQRKVARAEAYLGPPDPQEEATDAEYDPRRRKSRPLSRRKRAERREEEHRLVRMGDPAAIARHLKRLKELEPK